MPPDMNKYDKITNNDFDAYLREVIDNEYLNHPSDILEIPGIYEILSEHFNNEILNQWESDNHDLDAESDDSLNH